LKTTKPYHLGAGLTGQPILTPTIPPSTMAGGIGQSTSCDCLTPVGQPMVNSDGTTNVAYYARQLDGSSPNPVKGTLSLMQIGTDGTTTTTQLASSTTANLWPGQIIPDGQGGVLATWAIDPANPPAAPNPYQAADVKAGAVSSSFNMPMSPQNLARDPNTGIPTDLPLVGGENGTAFVSYGSNLASFNVNGGSSNWNYPSSAGITSAAYTNGGGLTVVDAQSNVTPLDSGGNAGTSVALPSVGSIQPAWDGTWQGTIPGSNIGAAAIQLPLLNWGNSLWAWLLRGSPSENGKATQMPYLGLLPTCPGAQTPCAQEALDDAIGSLRSLVSGNCPQCQTYVYSQPNLGLTQTTHSQYLARSYKFYDATNSSALAGDVLCIKHSIFNIFASPCNLSAFQMKLQINQLWALEKPAAITKTPSAPGEGLVTFWDPSQVNAGLGNSAAAIGNQATIFHESLHGVTGIIDSTPFGTSLQGIFGICIDDPSSSITDYLEFNVFGIGNAPKTKQTGNGTCLTWQPQWAPEEQHDPSSICLDSTACAGGSGPDLVATVTPSTSARPGRCLLEIYSRFGLCWVEHSRRLSEFRSK